MASIKYEVEEEIAVLSESKKAWKKELNLVSWNSNQAKYDIRDWNEDKTKMGKGITLTREELKNLKDALSDMDL